MTDNPVRHSKLRSILSSILLSCFVVISCQNKTELPNSQEELDRIIDRLEDLMDSDQILRKLRSRTLNEFGAESDEMRAFYVVMSKMDSINQMEAFKIIDQYGWLGISQVGDKANMAQWLILQHAPLDSQEKYMPQLKESVLKKESLGSHLAMLEDRVLMRNGKKQIYGSQVQGNPITGVYCLYPIQDTVLVHKKREEIGLNPLSEYLANYGITIKDFCAN